MSAHLVFLLYAPLGAMGAVAVGERRGSFDRPAKSSILGLIGAGLGVERSDEAGHLTLAEGFGLGLGEIASGRLLVDYHTTQAPPRRTNRHFRRWQFGLRSEVYSLTARIEHGTSSGGKVAQDAFTCIHTSRRETSLRW